MSGLYVLDGNGNPQPADTLVWGKWFEEADRRVAVDEIDDVRVSTVFLGIDHNFECVGPPVLWETMAFGLPDEDEVCERYTSKADALEGHKRICDQVRELGKGRRRE